MFWHCVHVRLFAVLDNCPFGWIGMFCFVFLLFFLKKVVFCMQKNSLKIRTKTLHTVPHWLTIIMVLLDNGQTDFTFLCFSFSIETESNLRKFTPAGLHFTASRHSVCNNTDITVVQWCLRHSQKTKTVRLVVTMMIRRVVKQQENTDPFLQQVIKRSNSAL